MVKLDLSDKKHASSTSLSGSGISKQQVMSVV